MQIASQIVGWKEWVALPELNVPLIKAKIDTGAATSSIHAYNIKYIKKNHINYVTFEIHPLQGNNRVVVPCEAILIEKRKVKSSNGKIQTRPVIKTNLQIGRLIIPIELNLTNRDSMGMRMLIGRQALKKLLVNPSCTSIQGKISEKTSIEVYAEKKS
jgi:ribosomal protein S6--L-glutamate ligase